MKDNRMYLSDLTTSSKKYSVKVKVIEKTRPKSAKNGILYQNLLLEDEKGIKMRGILFGEQIELYKDALVYNGLYEISNAPIKTCQEEWRTGPTDLMHQMSFNRLTGIQPMHIIGSGPILPQYQNISQIPRVSNTANRYDMVGIVLFVEEEPRKITTQQGKDYTVRELAIVDHSTEQPLLISAWNDLAHTECDLLASKANRLQIIGFTALKISSHKGFSMTTTMSTTFIHSPTGDKPTNLEHWRNRNQAKLTEMQERIITVRRSFPNKHKSTIATLHKKKAYNTIQDEKYILKVTIPEPSLDKVNAYLGCSKCGKGTDTQAGDVYSCTNCSSDNVISSPRVTFNCQVTDGTGNLPITTFTTNAEKILRMQAPDIFRMKHTEDNGTFESIKNQLQTSPITIEVGPTTTLAINSILQWGLKNVENNYLQDPTETAIENFSKTAESTKEKVTNSNKSTDNIDNLTKAPGSPQKQPQTHDVPTEQINSDTQKIIAVKIEGVKKNNPNVSTPNTEEGNPDKAP